MAYCSPIRGADVDELALRLGTMTAYRQMTGGNHVPPGVPVIDRPVPDGAGSTSGAPLPGWRWNAIFAAT